jgi:outer membrane receptor protein involved in Fe transport
MNIMKRSPQFNRLFKRSRLLGLAILGTAFSYSLCAQSTGTEAPKATDESIVKLDVFTVESTVGQSYGASNLASATRLNTPAENVPQSISVMNANLLRDIGAYDFDTSIRYTPGLTARQNGPDVGILRGFIVGNRHRNGFFMPRYESDSANVDRIEVIKGPSASIAGNSESGGLVNIVTKRPLFEQANSITGTIGSFGFMRAVVDTTGPVADREDMAYRLIASATQSDTYRDEDHIGKFAVYPSFAWNISDKTKLLVEVDYLQSEIPPGFGAVYFAPIEAGAPLSTVPPPVGVTPKVELNRWASLSLNTSGEPGMAWNHEVAILFTSLTHQFTDSLSVRQAVLAYDFAEDHYWATVDNTLYFDGSGNLMAKRGMFDQQIDTSGYRLQGDIAYKQEFADNKFGLVFLTGYDYSDTKDRNTYAAGTLEPINLVNPSYGLPPITPLAPAGDQSTKSGSVGLFANTQISALQDRVILTAGLRRDYNRAGSVVNHLNNTKVARAKTPTIESPMYGLTVKPMSWLALYGVNSEAGAAQTTIQIYPGIPVNDPRQITRTIEPVTTNKEFGAKMNFLDGNFSLNIAKFKIVQSDFVRPQTDFNAPGGSYRIIDQGTVSDGLEIEWAGDLTRQLMVFGGYTHMKTKVPAARAGGLDGEIRGVPDHKLQLFVRYNITDRKDRGFSIRAGMVHQTEVWGIAQNTFRVPGATRFDAGVDFRMNDWSISATVENLTDVIFAQATVGTASNTVDGPRAGYLTVARKF